MRKEVEVRYPHSASLFKFCRKVLDQKYGGARVIDQDVGQILGFDPADCSHWKKGKKNIRSIQAVKAIADQLEVDEKLVVDVATGDLSDWEALFEYNGYGAFAVDSKLFENAKKEFLRKNSFNLSKEREQEFKNQYIPDEHVIDQIVGSIHQKINLTEAPLYLPELAAFYPEIVLVKTPETASASEHAPIDVSLSQTKVTIKFPQVLEMRPIIRFQIAKGIGDYFLSDLRKNWNDMKEYGDHLREVQNNIFASKLLAPAFLIKKELKQINPAKDLMTQLAEVFWVSKSFINRRLKDILTSS